MAATPSVSLRWERGLNGLEMLDENCVVETRLPETVYVFESALT